VASRGCDQNDHSHVRGRPAADRIGADERPAEQAAGHEHMEVDCGMDQVAALSGGVQMRKVQRIQAAEVHGDRESRCGKERGRAAVQSFQQHMADRRRCRPQRQRDRCGQGKQCQARHAEQQVLKDVNAEQLVMGGVGCLV
jgi:hypothetical protein